MKKGTKGALVGAAILAAAGATTGIAVAGSDDDGTETPITGTDLQKATEAALAYTGGGEVTETEVGDEESLYEVEVTMSDGTQVDVQLDENFDVVGSESDESDDD